MSTNAEIFKKNMWTDNPVFMQILGICSLLAVTNLLSNTAIMAAGVVFVTGFSNLTVSLIKGLIPRRVRMIVQVLVISFYVIIVDIVLQAFLPEVSKRLGPYVGLIITNCIIMGRAEAFAQANPPLASLWDGITAGLGYMAVLMFIAAIREFLGFGSLFGIRILPESFVPWTLMITAPSAFFLLGFVIWIGKTLLKKQGVEV